MALAGRQILPPPVRETSQHTPSIAGHIDEVPCRPDLQPHQHHTDVQGLVHLREVQGKGMGPEERFKIQEVFYLSHTTNVVKCKRVYAPH